MAPLNGNKSDQNRNERKTQIINAAIKVFAENGIKPTKISMITAEAGISHGLLYHYFKSKDEVLHKSLEWATSGVTEIFQQINDMQLTPLGKIKQFTKFSFTESNSDVFRVIQHLIKSNDVPEHTKELVEKNGTLYLEYLLPIFIKGQEAEELVQGDPQELLELFLTVISGLMADHLAWWNEKKEHRIDILLRMITAR